MGTKFVALVSVAVGAVYGAGYIVTQPTASASTSINQTAVAPTSTSSNTNTTNNNSTNNTNGGSGSNTTAATAPNTTSSNSGTRSQTGSTSNNSTTSSATHTSTSSGTASNSTSKAASTAPKSPPKSSQPPATQQQWLDGTYQGSGSNAIGAIYVAVTIKSGKIANVQITQCDTHYPESYIDPVMPQAVIQQQQANVGYVSGATLSSFDFMNGVNQALAQAKNPNYKG